MAALAPSLLMALAVIICTTSCAAAGRTLKVSINSAMDRPVTRAFDDSLLKGSPDLPPGHPRITKLSNGCDPEQVHLTYWTATSVLVSYASCDAKLYQTQPVSTQGIRSIVFYGTSPNSLTSTAEGVTTSYAVDFTPLKRGTSYASPLLHHVLLKGLTPGQTYYYKVASSTATKDLSVVPSGGHTFSFALPKPASFPLKIGVFGDAGQTFNTTVTLERLIATKPQLVINAGDFSYADRWMGPTEYVPSSLGVTYEPKWDTWARLFEPLLSSVPMLHTDGNHERSPFPNGDHMTAYNARYPTPYLAGHDTSKGPSHFTPVTAKGDAFSNLYYAVDVPGVMKFISLTSYAPGQTFDHSEPQYKWLSEELAKTNRSRTPWVIISLHAPLYNTYVQHFKENECMRQSYEPLLVKHQVDLILHGHTHAYERMKPVVDYKVSQCGPQYITIGDGGNVEGLTLDHIDIKQPEFCKDPVKLASKIFAPRYQPQQCFSYQDGRFCSDKQPEWSAFREPGFGFGTLEILSAREAKWTWVKNSGPDWQVADSVTITRDTSSSSTC